MLFKILKIYLMTINYKLTLCRQNKLNNTDITKGTRINNNIQVVEDLEDLEAIGRMASVSPEAKCSTKIKRVRKSQCNKLHYQKTLTKIFELIILKIQGGETEAMIN